MATLVLIHGGGPQSDDEATMAARVRATLVLPDTVDVRIGWYADIRHGGTEDLGLAEVLAASVEPAVTPDEAARTIVTAVVTPASSVEGLVVEPTVTYAAIGTIRSAFEAADLVALRWAGPEAWPATAQRLRSGVVDGLADVAAYFLRPERVAMRDRVRTAIAAGPPGMVVAAHSLGSIIAADALAELGQTVDLRRFVTFGSPLGLPWVKLCLECCSLVLRCSTPPGLRLSDLNPSWINGWDRDDPVGGPFDHTFTDEYRPADRSEDREVDTGPDDPHELHRYLSTEGVSRAIREGLGLPG